MFRKTENNIKAVIFDMDGVIIDSGALWKRAEKEVFSSVGVQLTDELCKITEALTTTEVTQFWYDRQPWESKSLKEVENEVIELVVKLIKEEGKPINGIDGFIRNLKSEGYKLGLATNSPVSIIAAVQEKLNITHLFDSILSAEFEKKGKPDPAIYKRAAEKLNTKPSDCIVIEDSCSGMQAAKSAGMKVVAFTNGNKESRFDIADYHIDNFENNKLELIREY